MILKTPITLAEPLGGTLTHVVARLVSDNQDEWVSPFGNLRVKGCSHLTAAYRSVPRPSSPVHAKASTKCSYLTLEKPTPSTTSLHRTCHRNRYGRYLLSQIIICSNACVPYPYRCLTSPRLRHDAPRHRLKNPFTMSKICGQIPRNHSPACAESGNRCLHLWILAVASLDA